MKPADAEPLIIVPVTFDTACRVIALWHRHHAPPVGHKFSIGVATAAGRRLCGVATCGRPVARHLDDGFTVEVNRSATDGTRNANSALYGAAWRVARAMGYTRAVTYSQDGEAGASLRAAGWLPVATREPRPGWDMPSRPRAGRGVDGIARTFWAIQSARHDPSPARLPEFDVEPPPPTLDIFGEAG